MATILNLERVRDSLNLAQISDWEESIAKFGTLPLPHLLAAQFYKAPSCVSLTCHSKAQELPSE